MAIIGDLVARLSLDQSGFTKGVNQSQSTLKGMTARMASAVKGAAGLATGLAGVAGIAGIGALTKASAEAMTTTNKLAKSLGVETKALSQLKFAARQTGVEFDDIVGAFEELNIRMGEAVRDGTGPAAEAFKNLGLEVSALEAMSPEARFEAIAQALSQIQSETKRGFLSDEIFGGDAFKILPLLLKGKEGIRELRAEADRLGVSFDSIDAGKVGLATKSINKMRDAISGIGNELAVAIAPAVELMANSVTGNVQVAGNAFSGFIDDMLFGWRNASDTAQFTLLSIAHSALTTFPQIEGIATSVVATITAHYSGLFSFYKSLWNNMKLILLEFKNVADAVFAAVSAGFKAAFSGKGIRAAIQASSQAFTETLAKQADVASENPLAAYEKSFKSTYKNMTEEIEKDGGLTSHIEKQLDTVSGRMAAREREFKEKMAAAVSDGASLGKNMSGSDDSTNTEEVKNKLGAGSIQNSKEAFDKILTLRNSGGEKKKDQGAEETKKMHGTLKDIDRILGGMASSAVIRVGAFD